MTLITGDKVIVTADGTKAVITNGAGRDRIRFASYRVDGRRYVVPEDAVQLVGAGKLDRRLFDVTGLVAAGYDDARTSSIPLIVSYAESATAATPKVAGVEVAQRLDVIDGVAIKLSTAAAAAAWPRLEPITNGYHFTG